MKKKVIWSCVGLLAVLLVAGVAVLVMMFADDRSGSAALGLSDVSPVLDKAVSGGSGSEMLMDGVPASAGGNIGSVASGGDVEVDESRQSMGEASLKAGSIDDNKGWQDYLAYRERYQSQRVRRVDVAERYVITVMDANDDPVHGALVSVSYDGEDAWSGRTYADGRTLWMPGSVDGLEVVDEATVSVEVDGMELVKTFAVGEVAQTEWKLRLEDAWAPEFPVPLDVVYLIDATGSMSDEMGLLKETLAWVAVEIEGGEVAVDLRMGMVAYRDRGEDFVTKVYELSDHVEGLRSDVRGLHAEAGGDEDESLNEGLYEAVSGMNWRGGEAVKLVFLVADAGPHLDYEQDRDYSIEMRKALADGIKVHAVATSGLDAFGEYVFRQVAQHTMGEFIFLVYGGATTHDVGEQFTEDDLDQLIVDLVLSEVQHLDR